MKFLSAGFHMLLLYILFRTGAGHRRGRGVHPPFAYRFIREAVFGEDKGGLEGIEDLRKSLGKSREYLIVDDGGAGSKNFSTARRSKADLARVTAVSRKKGRLLARIFSYAGAEQILELGTGTGISTLYLAMACPGARIMSCEGSAAMAEFARSNIRRMGVQNVEVFTEDFRSWLPRRLNQSAPQLSIFIDGDHRGRSLLDYTGMIRDSGLSRAMVVLDDIHWSPDMHKAWKKLIRQEEISLSLELYDTGIIFLGYNIQKDHYRVNF